MHTAADQSTGLSAKCTVQSHYTASLCVRSQSEDTRAQEQVGKLKTHNAAYFEFAMVFVKQNNLKSVWLSGPEVLSDVTGSAENNLTFGAEPLTLQVTKTPGHH